MTHVSMRNDSGQAVIVHIDGNPSTPVRPGELVTMPIPARLELVGAGLEIALESSEMFTARIVVVDRELAP